MSDHAAPLQSFTPVLRAVRIGVDCSSQQHTEWLAQLLPLLSVFDATRVRSKRRVVDALRSAIAALMLRAAAAPYGVIRNSTGRPQAVVVDSSGAHVPCPYRDVSASHHGDWVVVGGVNTRGACIGVDIVRVSEIAGCAASNHYLRSKFLDDEWDMLSRDPTARLLAAFWSAKEAHAKATGVAFSKSSINVACSGIYPYSYHCNGVVPQASTAWRFSAPDASGSPVKFSRFCLDEDHVLTVCCAPRPTIHQLDVSSPPPPSNSSSTASESDLTCSSVECFTLSDRPHAGMLADFIFGDEERTLRGDR